MKFHQNINKFINGTAESKLLSMYGDSTVDHVYGDSLSIMKRVFNLAIYPRHKHTHSVYHRSYLIGLSNPSQSHLAKALIEKLTRDKVGIKIIDND